MITLVTVTLEPTQKYIDCLSKSVVKDLELVDEVLLPKADSYDYREWQVGKVKFKEFGIRNVNYHDLRSTHCNCLNHALGLHEGIDRAKNEWVMLSDPDVFFYSNTDRFYLDLIEKYNINFIGLSHHNSINQSFTYFPNVLNCLVKKSDLPDESFLEEYLDLYNAVPCDVSCLVKASINNKKLRGKYLLPSLMGDNAHFYPNPTGAYETGCQLVIWSKIKNWKWLSFQTTDCNTYTSQYFKSNFKIKEKIPRKKLLYHAINGSIVPEQYNNYYKKFTEHQNDNSV